MWKPGCRPGSGAVATQRPRRTAATRSASVIAWPQSGQATWLLSGASRSSTKVFQVCTKASPQFGQSICQ